MRVGIFILLWLGMTWSAAGTLAIGAAEQNKGAKEIELNGGSRGKVPFPHHRHQEILEDCNICHSVFEQKAGIIDELKAEGKLKKKYVMNKLCNNCHKKKILAGEKAGPITCVKCHVKN